MSKNWNDFYSRNLHLKDYLENLYSHGQFIEEIVKEKPKSILEVGVGTGIMSIFLSYLGVAKVVAIDNNIKILESGINLCEILNGKVLFKLCDAFNLSEHINDEFDIVFSQGFFEHFDDEDIKKLLGQQLKIGNKVVFSVPSNYYPKQEYGNERLLKLEHWKRILKDFNLESIRYYSDWLSLSAFFTNLIKHPYPPIKKPYHILIKLRR